MKHTIKQYLLAWPLAMLALAMGTSCEDAIVRSDSESPYADMIRLEGKLVDVETLRNSAVVEMRADEYTADVMFKLSTRPNKGVDIRVAVDEAYAQTYNTLHETDYELFPTANVSLNNGGAYVLAPDDQKLPDIRVTLTAFADMQEDQTYIVPLTVTTSTEGVTLSEDMQHMVLLVRDLRGLPTPDKGEDAVTNVLYFEVNDVNPLNALEFVTESGKYFFDHVVLFAANINWDAERKRVYVYNNPNVQFLLDNNEEYLQPLRKAGMKVIVSILGNHDQAGVAQLSDWGAREFARELAAYCDAYNLDGVTFDDEYSSSPDLDNPWLTSRSYAAAARLVYECKRAMPDKIVSVFSYEHMNTSGFMSIDGTEPGDYIDYAVGDYSAWGDYFTYFYHETLDKKQCSGMSIELNLGRGDSSESTARSRKEEGYGYYMFFALNPNQYSSRVSRCQNVCRGLYDEELVYPSYYYPKNSTVRTFLN